jgi:hypothetical protein
MFKHKNLAKIITHKYTLYFMYFLALLNGINYFKKQKVYCPLIAIAFFLLSNKFLTKNKALSIFYSLFLSNFVLGCGKIIEGNEGQMVTDSAEVPLSTKFIPILSDSDDPVNEESNQLSKNQINDEYTKATNYHFGGAAAGAHIGRDHDKKLSTSEEEKISAKSDASEFVAGLTEEGRKKWQARTEYKDGWTGDPDDDPTDEAIWKLYKQDQALKQSNTHQYPEQVQASAQQQPRQVSRQQQPRQASAQQQPRQAPGQQPTAQPQPRQQPRQVPQEQSTHTHTKQVVLITASAVASALALIVATGAIFLVNKKKF